MSHLLENNSTNKPLLANEVFLGSPVLIDSNQITASVSFSTDVPGQLEFLHSQNGRDFFNFEDIFQYYGASHNRQVSLKGLYIRIKYTNGPINQQSFLLFCRLLTSQNDDMNVNVDYRHDSILCYANEGGFDIRSLTSNLDSVSVPAIEACITGTALKVLIQNTSGLNNTNIFDSNGDTITTNENGELRVAGNFNMRYLSSTTDSVSIPPLTYAKDAVNVSGSSVSVSGSVSISNQISNYANATNQIITNTKLDTLNTTITNKTNNGFVDSIQIYGSNGITNKPFIQDNFQSLIVNSVDNSISEAPFDLIINGPTLYADSTPANPFFADLNGREGWYYDNLSNIANRSNIYWYANPVSGSFKENNMTYEQLSSMYCIITCDYVENGELTIPTMAIFSQPTGTNDFIPTFAHSRWVFQLSALNRSKLRKGECIMLYTGPNRPNVHTNITSYPLNLVSQNGDCLSSEIIAYMTVNTQATTSKIGYLLEYCGYLNSNVGFNKEYSFKNSKNRLIQNNLSASRILVDTGLTNLNVDIGITNIAINNFSELNGLNVDTGLTNIAINNFSELNGLNVDTGLTNIAINNFSQLNGLNVDTGLTNIAINNFSELNGLNVDTGLTNISINNFSELNGLNVDTGLTNISINNFSELNGLNVDTGLTNIAINNFSELNGLNVDTGLTSIFINNSSLNVNTGLTSIFINNSSLNVNTGLTGFALESTLQSIKAKTDLLSAGATAFGPSIAVSVVNGVLVRSETYSGDGDSISATYNSALNKIGLDTTIVNANPISITCSNFPSGFKVLDDNENGLGYGTNPLIIDGTVSLNTSGLVGISGDVRAQGYDYDTGVYSPIYTDVDGVQRFEQVQPHIVSAKYVIEQDVNIIAKLVANPSTNSNAYSVDSRGREGWHFDNINTTPGIASGANTLDWYKSTINTPPALTIQKLQGLYAVICFDKLPLNAFHSYFVVTTSAGSTWFYYNPTSQISSIYPGETYLLYYGQKVFSHKPEIQNSSKLEMIRVLNIGPGNVNETITNIQLLNVDETALNVYSYLISECGLYDNDRQNWFQTYFRNTIDFDANTNLSNLTLTGNNLNVNVTNSSIPVTGTFYQATQPVSIASTVPVSIASTIDTNITNASLTVSDTTSQGYLNTINKAIGYNYIEVTIPFISLAGSTISSFTTWTRGQYKRTVFNYSDNSTTSSDSVSIYIKDDLNNSVMLATFYPYVIGSNRLYSGILELSPFNAIAIGNNSASSISSPVLKLFSA